MRIIIFMCILMAPLMVMAEETAQQSYAPEAGYVPDAKTAIAIAVAIWTPVYGKEKIKAEKPFTAELREGVWYVSGSLPEGMLGGVAEADIAKDTGCIVRISHGK